MVTPRDPETRLRFLLQRLENFKANLDQAPSSQRVQFEMKVRACEREIEMLERSLPHLSAGQPA